MAQLNVRLLGKFSIGVDRQDSCNLPGGKTQELFFYLLLHRHQPHSREAIAALLWPEYPTAKSKKNLRQTLWQLHTALAGLTRNLKSDLLTINAESIYLDGDGTMVVDVTIFERAYKKVHEVKGKALDSSQVKALQQAIELYHGDLLEGCYEDWCLVERERLQNCYLIMLDKLICHCRNERDYQGALDYGERVLRLDRAHERTHQQLMRVHYESGNRTAALRQYDRCKTALREELGVEPSQQTRRLCEQIRREDSGSRFAQAAGAAATESPAAVGHLKQLLEFINRIELEVKEELRMAWQQIHKPAQRQDSKPV